ncbi:MAG: hypothetical protein R3183_08465 [Oleiphilaceae bacterium]|nr:hypothetical protein [Oleiphilaceae bacterium]
MFWHHQLLRQVGVLSLLSTLVGCAATSVFNPYPNQAMKMKAAMVPEASQGAPVFEQTLANLAEHRNSADAQLYMMERGRLTQIASRFEESKQDFELVIDKFEANDLSATVQTSSLGAQGASLLTNDNALPYQGSGYERIFTHLHQALNYWALGKIEGAAVEFRKAGLEQQILLEKHEQEVAEAQQKAEEKDIELGKLSEHFAGLDTVAGQVKSSFQNAYTFYTAATFWEATGELNSALVDYKKALEINPSAEFIKQDIARVARKLGDTSYPKSALLKEDEGMVVIAFEEGFVPAKSEIKIPIPMADGSVIALAFPFYDTQFWPYSPSLKIRDDQFNDHGTTQTLTNVSALAVKDLKERLPGMLVRQTLRGITKHQMQKQSGEQMGLAGSLIANVYNIISESADRRSWLTLPHTAQATRLILPAGQRQLSLSTPATQTNVTLDINPNRTTLLRVIGVNNQLITQVFTL